jgi:hypothetical protein
VIHHPTLKLKNWHGTRVYSPATPTLLPTWFAWTQRSTEDPLHTGVWVGWARDLQKHPNPIPTLGIGRGIEFLLEVKRFEIVSPTRCQIVVSSSPRRILFVHQMSFGSHRLIGGSMSWHEAVGLECSGCRGDEGGIFWWTVFEATKKRRKKKKPPRKIQTTGALPPLVSASFDCR